MTSTLETGALRALTDRFDDRLLHPGDAGYDEARAPWNLAVDQHPAAIAFPQDIDELQALLIAARVDGLQLAVQPGGHGASGSLEGAVLVRTAAFDEVTIDVDRRIARVGAGVKWAAVLAALEGTGLVALAGSSEVVHTVPFVLAGGHSWFSRAFGVAASSLHAVELLTADGRHRWVSDENEPALMWALRGAGGAFGIVTAVEIELYPAHELVGGRLAFDGADLMPVLRAALSAMQDAPNSVAIHAGAIRFPDVEQAPPPLRGRTIVSVQAVSLDGAEVLEAVLAPIRAAGAVELDTMGPFGIEALAGVADEPTDPSGSYSWARFADLGPADLEAMIAAWQSAAGQAVFALEIRGLGGALAESPARATVSGPVVHPHVVSARALAFPGAEAAAYAGLSAVRESLGSALSEHVFATFLEDHPSYAGAYGTESVARVEAIRRLIDPEARFRGNRSTS